jgi:DNA-binding MarR family transcriptional regulator
MRIKFDETVSYALAKVSIAFRNTIERHMNQAGLHAGQTFVLLELWREDGLRQIELARRLNLSAPTINKVLKGLLQIHLVRLASVPSDARASRVFLTPEGRDMREQVEDQWLELEENCLSGLTETERLILFELLGKLRTTYTGAPAADEEI